MKHHPIKIVVCLSVYNGSLYLQEQLISIANQSCDFSKMILCIRDDDSSDESKKVIQGFTRRTSLKVMVLTDKTNLGVKKSFELLMSKAIDLDAKYIMFCDQDDVWNKDKIEKTYNKMKELEKIYSKDIPLLVHSDLKVVDNKIEVIAPSFWKYQSINPNKQKLSDFIVNNNITGCTMMINRSLAEKIRTIPKEAIMHDWWIAMVASAFGKIAYINEPLMLYRQHGNNDTGAKQYGLRYFIKKFFAKPSFVKYIHQSKAFLALYGQELDEYHKSMLEEFSSFDRLSKYHKLRVLFKYKIWKSGFMRNIGLIFFA